MMTTQRRRKLTEPLESVTAFFGYLLLLGLAAGIGFAVFGSGSLGGLGNATICATQPNTTYGGSDWASSLGAAARPGASISINGTLQACATSPGVGQRVLYTLTSLPGLLLWGVVLFLLWRVIRAANQTGPFTPGVAVAMQRLGWLIIAGTVVAAAVQAFALHELLNTMLRLPGSSFAEVVIEPIKALVPVPALAGAALLTFARIIRLGADMDDELKTTV
jgi:hypothetical protein